MDNTQDWSCGVSIIVPTYKRPEGIRTALKSLMLQTAADRPLEIIVADNDPAGSAKDFVESFAKSAQIKTFYVHVPEPGVSNARNGAMEAARGRYRAFLDDDMEATETWLSSLLEILDSCPAGVCFGPIDAVMPDKNDLLNRHMHPFFSREYEGEDGLVDEAFGMGGCLIDLKRCDMPFPPFNTDLNEVGGEDDWLFSALTSQGTQMAWASTALTYEHVPQSRLNMSYFWDRNFKFGQGPSQNAADRGLGGLFGVVKWMLVGAAQTLVFAPIYAALKLLRSPQSITYHAKLAQGIGKILWWDGFSPRMYGNAATANSKAS